MMNDGAFSDKQFIAIFLIIIICGFLIAFHDTFVREKNEAYERMSVELSQEPNYVYVSEGDDDDGEEVAVVPRRSGDPSGKVKKKKVTYNYAGRLIIPSINLDRGFMKRGQAGNNVDQNIAVLKGSRYPDNINSNLILAAHSGTGWNAFFDNIYKLKKNNVAYIKYNGKKYKYKVIKTGKDKKKDRQITIDNYNDGRYLTLVTCKKPDYKTYYLVVTLKLVAEEDL